MLTSGKSGVSIATHGFIPALAPEGGPCSLGACLGGMGAWGCRPIALVRMGISVGSLAGNESPERRD